jgi:cytochrome P450
VVSISRTATADTELGGTLIRDDEQVIYNIAAANRDPEMFDDPHAFDITRVNARKHIAFGAGRHYCAGAQLARIETQIMLEEFLRRMPDAEIDGDPIHAARIAESTVVSAVEELPIRFTPGAKVA